MNHPMYRDTDSAALYPLWKKDKKIFDRRSVELLRANDLSVEYLSAMNHQFLTMREIEKNGNVLIDVDGEKWKSEISRKTISTMKVKDIKFPFTAGAIVDPAISAGYLLFWLGDDILTITVSITEDDYHNLDDDRTVVDAVNKGDEYSRTGGIVSFRIPLDQVLSEYLEGREVASRHVYLALSILMYISAFRNDSTRVKSINMKATKPSKKKGIPKHKINKILLYQHEVEHAGSGGGSGGVLTKAHIVRGHWRNQWYSSLDGHKPKWIDPYFKGKGKEEISKIYKMS